MVTAEDKAQRIYNSFVKCFDPHYGILIKKNINDLALKASKLHCIHMVDELQLVLEKLGYRGDEYDDLDTIEYPLKRLRLYQDVLKHLETMK